MELWKLEKGWLAAYTEDKTTIKSIQRYKPHWTIMAEYTDSGQLKALQYKIPMSERRQAERMFNTKLADF
ncbi:hypothetical protein M3181_03215 [Mesobacillus maritimus]|uniref:hypothetical protein n=1 Tax=Mesobacillus maritimus TaxID=1643336 RepID=UPI00203AEAC0|nr:hypothetical protein [Mesobacillus maritimus]MCM3668011.1 hypothetical protein [Mesobacillus maritimus]